MMSPRSGGQSGTDRHGGMPGAMHGAAVATEFDYLAEMVAAHHMMAVMMSQQLLVRGLAEHDEVNDLVVHPRQAARRDHPDAPLARRLVRRRDGWHGSVDDEVMRRLAVTPYV
jgi:hypothetical protein